MFQIIDREKELDIRKYREALARKNQYSLTTTTTNNNVWKTACIVFFGVIGLSCLGGIAYLIGQNSNRNRYNRCKC